MAFDYEKLQAIGDKRHWVRVTRACNNRCIFCLDMDNLNGTHVDDEVIRADIRKGLELGCTRLILSGGEASINPRFIEYVRYGKELGYERIQTVSNGRMYCKQSYLEELVEAGLGEITFSVHGHTEALHDDLVAARGAWKQINKGIDNAVALRDRIGSPIVSIDVVITNENYKYIHEIIAMFAERGVYEYDLLHLTPFGSADMEKEKDRLFIDIHEAYPYLQKAFAYARKPGFFIWTNRFPATFLEGFEDLIQDPWKLKDEVIGRMPLFERFFKKKKTFPCKGWRCPHCHMQGLCEQVHKDRDAWDAGTVERLAIDVERYTEEGLQSLVGRSFPSLRALQLVHLDSASFETVLPLIQKVAHLEVKNCYDREVLRRLHSLREEQEVTLFYDKDADLAALPVTPTLRYKFEITRKQYGDLCLLAAKLPLVTIVFPNYVDMGEAGAKSIDPKRALDGQIQLYKKLRKEVRFENIPRCLFPSAERREAYFDASLLDTEEHIDLLAYVPYYINNFHYNKTVRCRSCELDTTCEGYHINNVRSYGFRQLTPICSSHHDGSNFQQQEQEEKTSYAEEKY